MEVQPQSSPTRKEPAGEEKLVQLDDLRTLLKEERQSWKEELKHELQGWSARVNTSLGKVRGRADPGGRENPDSAKLLRRDRQSEETRMKKRMGAIENKNTTLGSHTEGEGERRRALIRASSVVGRKTTWRRAHSSQQRPWWHSYALTSTSGKPLCQAFGGGTSLFRMLRVQERLRATVKKG